MNIPSHSILKHIGVALLLLVCLQTKAQEVLLERDPAIDTADVTFGPNRRHFSHPYIAGGAVTGPRNNGGRLAPLGNYYIALGYRYKYRFNDFFALGFEYSVSNTTLTLRQEKAKILPDTIRHKTERLNWMHLNLGFYTRVNFYKRGDIMGNYLDLGVSGSWCPSFVHFWKDKEGSRTIRTRERGLKYIERFGYSAFARLGLDRFAISVSYRLSKAFKASSGYPNIAPLTATIEIALY